MSKIDSDSSIQALKLWAEATKEKGPRKGDLVVSTGEGGIKKIEYIPFKELKGLDWLRYKLGLSSNSLTKVAEVIAEIPELKNNTKVMDLFRDKVTSYNAKAVHSLFSLTIETPSVIALRKAMEEKSGIYAPETIKQFCKLVNALENGKITNETLKAEITIFKDKIFKGEPDRSHGPAAMKNFVNSDEVNPKNWGTVTRSKDPAIFSKNDLNVLRDFLEGTGARLPSKLPDDVKSSKVIDAVILPEESPQESPLIKYLRDEKDNWIGKDKNVQEFLKEISKLKSSE